MIRQALTFAFVALSVSAHAAQRPYPVEQLLKDTFPSEWAAAGLQDSAYQPFSEYVIMDSAAGPYTGTGDTCEPSYPFNPRMAAAGVTDCLDVRPPNWADVSCAGASGQHPSLSNVYIIRPSSPNWVAASNSQYRWVLQCPGSYEQGSRLVISSGGVGPNTGEMKVYDCLDADGSYNPMRPFPLRTGTVNECHHGPVHFDNVQYVLWNNVYSEGTTREWTNAGLDFDGNNSGTNYFVIVNNFDWYGGGQTVSGTGFRATYPGAVLRQGRFFGLQNFRLTDCIARRRNDDIAIGITGGGVSDFIIVNGEITNCGHSVMIGEGGEGEVFPSEAGYVENMWLPPSDARFAGIEGFDWRYWDGFAQNARIPYGYSIGGDPPSYVKAAALAPGDIDDAFKCAAGGKGSKYADACPFECNEQRMIGSKTGARVAAGSQRHLVRRVFSWGCRSSRVDNNNDLQDGVDDPPSKSASCGASSGDERNSGKVWTQNRGGGVTYDLIFGQGSAGPMNEVYFSTKNNRIADVVVTNSIFISTYNSWMNNQYTDDHVNYIISVGSSTNNPGQLNRYDVHGNTYAMQGYENAPGGAFGTKRWRGSGASPTSMKCSVIIDYANDEPDSNISVDYLALYGSAGDHNNIANRFPATLTYDKGTLTSFTHVTHPWTSLGEGALMTRTWDGLIPAEGSPIVGACAAPVPQ